MNPKLQDILLNKYPRIFKRHLPACCPFDQWGIECDDGWFDLIDLLCEFIQSYIDSNNKEQVECLQAKSKFSFLRFYINGGDDYIEGAIEMISHLSYKTCEDCGSIKNIGHTKGWIVTLCEDCAKKENRVWELDKINE